jgi:phospholipid transport system substrate-binding protein
MIQMSNTRIVRFRWARFRVALIAAALLLPGVRSAAQNDDSTLPESASTVDTVQQLLDTLINAARLDDVIDRYEMLSDVVIATHDLDYIAQMTVRRPWRDWDETQRQSFVDEFRRLSVMNYAVRFSNVAEDSFELNGFEPAGGSRVQVNVMVLRANDSPVPLDFVLQRDTAQRWRIANVVADGVSDLALKRAEYRALLDDAGFAGLVDEIAAQTNAMAEGAD